MEDKQKPTITEIIASQSLDALYNALNEIELLQYKFETVPQICRLIMGDCNEGEPETNELLHSMLHYTEYLAKDLGEQTIEAHKCYYRIREADNGK